MKIVLTCRDVFELQAIHSVLKSSIKTIEDFLSYKTHAFSKPYKATLEKTRNLLDDSFDILISIINGNTPDKTLTSHKLLAIFKSFVNSKLDIEESDIAEFRSLRDILCDSFCTIDDYLDYEWGTGIEDLKYADSRLKEVSKNLDDCQCVLGAILKGHTPSKTLTGFELSK